MVQTNTSPVTRWNIFARELEDMLNVRGLHLGHLDDRAFIHREKVRRLRQSLLRPKSFPVLSPDEMETVIRTFQLGSYEILRLRAALFATAIEEMLMDRINRDDALQIAEQLLSILLRALQDGPVVETQEFSGTQSGFVRWNIFARELEYILALRGLRLTQLDSRTSIHREKVRRLIRSLHSPKSFPVLSPEEVAEVTATFGLTQVERLRLHAALFATAIEEMLMDRINRDDALLAAEQLLPVLIQGLLTLESRAIPSAINTWLEEKRTRTNSERTITTYCDELQQFRTYLHQLGLELNGDPEALAKAAHEWASTASPTRTQPAFISPATYNQRLSILSSFYQYICNQKFYIGALFCNNPIDLVPRASLQESERIPLLDQEAVKRKLAHIGRTTNQGKRDYALLCVILTANCRASELAGLRYGHVEWTSTHMAITWEGRNESQQASTVLVPAAAAALKEYLYAIYGDADFDIVDELPIWVSFSPRNQCLPFQAIGTQTIADICQKYLGVSTIRAARGFSSQGL